MLKKTSYVGGKRVVEIELVSKFEELPPPKEFAGKKINVTSVYGDFLIGSVDELPQLLEPDGLFYRVQDGSLYHFFNGEWLVKMTQEEMSQYSPGLYESDGENWNYVCSLSEAALLST